MTPAAHRVGAVALVVAAACAHPQAGAPPRDVTWPAPPAAPRVRLVQILPQEGSPTLPFWRRALAVVAGTEEPSGAPPPLVQPFGVAADPRGGVIVTDPDGPTVNRFRGDRASRIACRDRAWRSPLGVAVLPDGAILVGDGGQLVRVAPDGACSSFGPGELERATGIASCGPRIFVTDPPRHAVIELDGSGAVVRRLHETGGAAELYFPSALACAPDGSLLVADTFNFSVARWDGSGAFSGRLGGSAPEAGGLMRPKGVAAGPRGEVFVSDAERDEIVAYRPDGRIDYMIGATGSGPGQLAQPSGLAIAEHRLYVADSLNGRVQVFEFVGGEP